MHTLLRHARAPLATTLLITLFAGCAAGNGAASPSQTASEAPPTSGAAATPAATASDAPPASSPAASQAPDVGGGTTYGDVPDNAVFLTYRQASLGCSIQYVEGWQVTTRPDGVVINDKDSSEIVQVVDLPGDVAGFIASTDLPALRAQTGFKLIKQDTVKVGAASLHHLTYHALSPADPVTGKQIPSTVDRYYVPGPAHLAIISLSTPDGVDNVDAFRQMIESFRWT
jgi:hypothetical protein